MKQKTLLVLFSLFTLAANNVYAQQHVVAPCIDSMIKKSADSVVRALREQSFSIVHSASLTMESDYESAIIVDLKKEDWYVLAFVGAKNSKLFQVTMLDFQQRRVAYEKQKSSDKDGNILIFPYKPDASGNHIINPLQLNKKKTICGQMMLFKKILP